MSLRRPGQEDFPLVDRSRTPQTRRPGIAPRKQDDQDSLQETQPGERQRRCPWCESTNTRFFKRGLTGPTDERDQYFTCEDCGRLTYEIVSRTRRDMRVGQFRAGGSFRDNARKTKYTITRVLNAGMNEVLLYLKPIIPGPNDDVR
jgi:hypothetical protein